MIRREWARRKLIRFCQFCDPLYDDADHLKLLADKLHEVERYVESGGAEGIGRLIVNMPPRHGKSETGSKRWPAFLLGRHPKWHIGLIAYNDGFAGDFSRANRELIANSDEYRLLFPKIKLHPASQAVERWALAGGDLDDPSVVATGIGGALTGRGFEIIIIDDPVKNRAEAESPTYRKNLHDAYKGTIRTRLEPGGAIVIICTRWHEDDLPGWLLEQESLGDGEHFETINIPALAEPGDMMGRKLGEALWTKRFGRKDLLLTKMALGSYEWEAQYQGHPKPPEGGKIRREWFQVIDADEMPARFKPGPDGEPPAERLQWYRYWDLAATAKTTSNHTAAARVAFDSDGYLYIADMVRGRWEWPEQKKQIKATMKSEKALGVKHGVESALHGTSAVQEFMTDKELHNVAFEGVDVHVDKLTRALPWIGRAEAGKVILIAGVWVGAFLDEAANFTGHNDKDDDQIDTISGGVAMSEQKPKKLRKSSNPFYG